MENELVYSTLRPAVELNTLSQWLVTPKMSDIQILVISTTINPKKNVNPSMSNLGSEHKNKLLTYKLLPKKFLPSGKCLKEPNEGI